MFVVCPSCSRHVRENESSCPFCAQAIPAGIVPVPHGPHRRYVGKNATALAIIAMAAGCGGTTSEEPAADTGVVVDAAKDTAFSVDSAMPDTGPFDTGAKVDTGYDADDGGPVPIYK